MRRIEAARSGRRRHVATFVAALALCRGGGRAWADDPPAASATDPAVEELLLFVRKAERELHRLDRVTLRWLHASASEPARGVQGVTSYAVDRAVPKARRRTFGAGPVPGRPAESPRDPALAAWWKDARLPADLTTATWWRNAQPALDDIHAQRSPLDRAGRVSYEVTDGLRHTSYHEEPTVGRWSALRRAGPFFMAESPYALWPAYYLCTGETIAQNLRRMAASRVVRTGFGKTAVVSIGAVDRDYGQWLILRGDGEPIVEEWTDAKRVSLDGLVDRLRKAETIEETRAWPEVLTSQRVLTWIESKDFPPVPETTVMVVGRGKLSVHRTTYVGPLDPSVDFEAVPAAARGRTIDLTDFTARVVERHHPDGRVEPLDSSHVPWEK